MVSFFGVWLLYEMKNYSELGGIIYFGLRPQLACSGRPDGGEWREMESGARKRERGGGGGGERREEAGRRFFRPLSPPPPPSLCFPAHFSLSRPHYLNAWNRIDLLDLHNRPFLHSDPTSIQITQ